MSQPKRVPGHRLGTDRATRLARACEDIAEVGAAVDPGVLRALARLRAPGVSEYELDAALAEVDDVLRSHGLVGTGAVSRGTPGSTYQPLPGVRGGRPLEEVHVCPGDLCDRVEPSQAGTAAAPTCAVWNCPLPLFRLDR